MTTSAGATASSDWWRDSFRKVCLRAEPREWEAMRELDHERVGDVACLPPVRRGLRDRVLVRMQALSDEAGALPPLPEPLPDGLTLAVATHLGMSAGKVLAQIGHAALMADPDPELDVNVVGAGDARVGEALGRRAVAIVRDGGLTELGTRLGDRARAAMRALIVNPFASGVTEARLAAVEAVLPAGTETLLTAARGDATDFAAEWSPRAEAIYVFSGDGTYNEVLNGLRADIAVGFLPGGGTSVLPRALGLPRDPVRAAERIRFGKPRRISLGRINGRLFAFNAGIGLDAELVRRVDALGRREDGKRPGDVAFGLAVLKVLAERRFRYPRVARGRGARPGGVRPRRELLAVHLCRAPRAALRAGRVLRGRPRRRRAAGRARGQGSRGSRRRPCADVRAPAMPFSATTWTGS